MARQFPTAEGELKQNKGIGHDLYVVMHVALIASHYSVLAPAGTPTGQKTTALLHFCCFVLSDWINFALSVSHCAAVCMFVHYVTASVTYIRSEGIRVLF